jgi:hypothetical protein
MISFVVPLKSARVSRDWKLARRLLDRTLRSACAQSHPDYRVLLICHELPSGVTLPRQCSAITAPFAPPELTTDDDLTTDDALFALHSDKGRKLLYGLERVRSGTGGYVMFLDADDLVSNRLAAFVAEHEGENGWYMDLGYKMVAGGRWLYPRRRFYRECGSSYILRSDLAPFPSGGADYSRDLNDFHVRRYVVHAYIRENMAKLGYPLKPLPFYGAIYRVNPESFYAGAFRKPDSRLRASVRWLLKGRRISPAVQREFGIGSGAAVAG